MGTKGTAILALIKKVKKGVSNSQTEQHNIHKDYCTFHKNCYNCHWYGSTHIYDIKATYFNLNDDCCYCKWKKKEKERTF